MRNRIAAVLLTLVAAVAFSACSGATTGASNVRATSAVIHAKGSCDTQCDVYFSINTLSSNPSISSVWTTNRFTVGKIKTTSFNATLTGLSPGTRYRYQVCGKEHNWKSYACVGPDGTDKTYSYFTTSQATAPRI